MDIKFSDINSKEITINLSVTIQACVVTTFTAPDVDYSLTYNIGSDADSFNIATYTFNCPYLVETLTTSADSEPWLTLNDRTVIILTSNSELASTLPPTVTVTSTLDDVSST